MTRHQAGDIAPGEGWVNAPVVVHTPQAGEEGAGVGHHLCRRDASEVRDGVEGRLSSR